MKRLVVEEFGAPGVLLIIESPRPDPGPKDVLVRVAGAGLNWIDISIRTGMLAQAGLLAPADRYTMGWDVAGIVEAAGSRVTAFQVGDAVVGLRDVLGLPGSHAEYVTLHQDAVTRAPDGVGLVSAAGIPLAGVTAFGALSVAGLRAKQSVLVTGAGGVIGQFCVAIAASRGIEVLAVGRSADAARLADLGATVIDAAAPLASGVRALVPAGVDAVVDTANLGTAAHEALRGAGTFVALVRPFAPLPLRGTTVAVQESWADPERLAEVVSLVETGVIETPSARAYPLAAAAEAHAAMEKGGLRGRVVLVP